MACSDCRQGPCARCLSEDHGPTISTLHLGHSIAVVPNYDGQELAAAFARAAVDVGLARLGIR